MLREASHERTPNRRWFSDDDFDLIVWSGDADTIVAIQLCYDTSSSERAVTWSPERGHEHFRVDAGERTPFRNETPRLVSDGPFRKERILETFLRTAAALDPTIRSFVVARLLEFPESLATSAVEKEVLVAFGGIPASDRWRSDVSRSTLGMLSRSGVRLEKEAPMRNRVRVNLANPAELEELPGIGPEQARAILRFRAEHGPIQDANQLAAILHAWPVVDALWDRIAFDPAESTAPEAPGA